MTHQEIQAKCKQYMYIDADYEQVGIRFEYLDREVGDVINNSRHNPDREDVREFPDYGTDEYNSLPELDGASAYSASRIIPADEYDYCKRIGMHCYIIGGESGTHDDPDEYEILVRGAVVLDKVF